MTRPRTTNRGHAITALAGPPLADKPLSRPCPTCEASPGWPCRRWVSGRVCGQETGGDYWRPLKKGHDDRTRWRAR
jgi:hypothetical protein